MIRGSKSSQLLFLFPVLPVVIILFVILAIIVAIILIACICKRMRSKRASKIRPVADTSSPPLTATPPSGMFPPLVAPLIVPTKTWKGQQRPTLYRSNSGKTRSSTHLMHTPYILNLPDNEVIAAGTGTGTVSRMEDASEA